MCILLCCDICLCLIFATLHSLTDCFMSHQEWATNLSTTQQHQGPSESTIFLSHACTRTKKTTKKSLLCFFYGPDLSQR